MVPTRGSCCFVHSSANCCSTPSRWFWPPPFSAALIGTGLRLVRRADGCARSCALGYARRGASGHSAVRLVLRLALVVSVDARFRRRAAGRHHRLHALRLPCRSSPRCAGWTRHSKRPHVRSGNGPWTCFVRVVSAAAPPGPARGHVVGCAEHAGRIRRLCPASLPHVHHRTLRRISHRNGRRRICTRRERS